MTKCILFKWWNNGGTVFSWVPGVWPFDQIAWYAWTSWKGSIEIPQRERENHLQPDVKLPKTETLLWLFWYFQQSLTWTGHTVNTAMIIKMQTLFVFLGSGSSSETF